jgi:hypothetical protein
MPVAGAAPAIFSKPYRALEINNETTAFRIPSLCHGYGSPISLRHPLASGSQVVEQNTRKHKRDTDKN